MLRKVIIVWLTSLCAWNAVFGAFGGLLLCIHDDALHIESAVESSATCPDNCGSVEAVYQTITITETCLDIELGQALIVVLRSDEGRLSLATSPLLLANLTGTQPVFNFNELTVSNKLRAPPLITAISVQVARTHALRI